MNYSLFLADDHQRSLGIEGEHDGHRFKVRTGIGGLNETEASAWIDWAAWLGYGVRAGLSYEQTLELSKAPVTGGWGA